MNKLKINTMEEQILEKYKDPSTWRNYVIIEGEKLFVDIAVASTFLPNPDPTKYTRVEHIDGDLGNDHVMNLRWVE
jgi:hypothetical protein